MNRAINIEENSKNTQLYESMIVVIMLFAPFTSLRFLRIGVTEGMSLALFLFVLLSNYNLKFNDKNIFVFTKFWLLFFFTSGIGVFYNYVLMPTTSGTIDGMLFDTMSYIVVFLACFSLEVIIYNKRKIDIDYILYNIFIFSSIALTFLFILSKFTGSIFGFSLLDGSGNFKPLADNIHHVSMFAGPLPFLGLYFLKNDYNVKSSLFYIILIVFDVIMLFNIGSDKAIMGFYLGSTIVLFFLLFEKISKSSKKYLYPLIATLLLIVIIINFEALSHIIKSVFAESDGEGARQSLYTAAFNHSKNSPLFGHGPGQHIPWSGIGFADSHSTFLTVQLQGGVIGLVVFVRFLIKLFNKFKLNPYILAAVSSIFIYIAGGDILRRLPIWIYLILFYYKNLPQSLSKNN